MELSAWEVVWAIFWGALGIAWATDAVLRRILGRWRVWRHPDWYDDPELEQAVKRGDMAWERGYLAGRLRVWEEVGRLATMTGDELEAEQAELENRRSRR